MIEYYLGYKKLQIQLPAPHEQDIVATTSNLNTEEVEARGSEVRIAWAI